MSEWKDKLQGKAKELKGKVSGDRMEEMKGKAQQALGGAEGKVGDLKDAWKHRQDQRPAASESDPNYTAEGYQTEAETDTEPGSPLP